MEGDLLQARHTQLGGFLHEPERPVTIADGNAQLHRRRPRHVGHRRAECHGNLGAADRHDRSVGDLSPAVGDAHDVARCQPTHASVMRDGFAEQDRDARSEP